jgi:hypothetical protein
MGRPLSTEQRDRPESAMDARSGVVAALFPLGAPSVTAAVSRVAQISTLVCTLPCTSSRGALPVQWGART